MLKGNNSKNVKMVSFQKATRVRSFVLDVVNYNLFPLEIDKSGLCPPRIEAYDFTASRYGQIQLVWT